MTTVTNKYSSLYTTRSASILRKKYCVVQCNVKYCTVGVCVYRKWDCAVFPLLVVPIFKQCNAMLLFIYKTWWTECIQLSHILYYYLHNFYGVINDLSSVAQSKDGYQWTLDGLTIYIESFKYLRGGSFHRLPIGLTDSGPLVYWGDFVWPDSRQSLVIYCSGLGLL